MAVKTAYLFWIKLLIKLNFCQFVIHFGFLYLQFHIKSIFLSPFIVFFWTCIINCASCSCELAIEKSANGVTFLFRNVVNSIFKFNSTVVNEIQICWLYLVSYWVLRPSTVIIILRISPVVDVTDISYWHLIFLLDKNYT